MTGVMGFMAQLRMMSCKIKKFVILEEEKIMLYRYDINKKKINVTYTDKDNAKYNGNINMYLFVYYRPESTA